MDSASERTLGSFIGGFAPINHGRLPYVHELAMRVNSRYTNMKLIQQAYKLFSDLPEIDDGWANLFQCNTSNTLWTCSHEISAPVACQEKNALGTFHYTSANITVAQNGMPASENTTSNATSCDSANRTAIATPTLTNSDATCPSIVSYNKTQLVAIGAGLGAGLGIPLLLVGGLLLYCSQAKRRQREQLQQQNQQIQQQSQYEHQYQPHINENSSQDMKRLTGSKWKPSELRSSFAGNELVGSTQGRSELPGSFGMI
jgi:hypothetical protein